MRKSKKISKKKKVSTGRFRNVISRTPKSKKGNKERPMVIRVTKDEFELDDGRIFPMLFDFSDDEVPSPEEFQKQYDRWLALFREMELTGNEEQR